MFEATEKISWKIEAVELTIPSAEAQHNGSPARKRWVNYNQ